jgi:hypothetical protein
LKNHHKGAAVVQVKFADWMRERPKSIEALELGLRSDLNEDVGAWMFISVDVNGMVIVNEVTKVLGLYYTSDRVLINPAKFNGAKYQTITTKFYSDKNRQESLDFDMTNLIALGSTEQVAVYVIGEKKMELVYTI